MFESYVAIAVISSGAWQAASAGGLLPISPRRRRLSKRFSYQSGTSIRTGRSHRMHPSAGRCFPNSIKNHPEPADPFECGELDGFEAAPGAAPGAAPRITSALQRSYPAEWCRSCGVSSLPPRPPGIRRQRATCPRRWSSPVPVGFWSYPATRTRDPVPGRISG